jgi:hypothetical protein
MNPRANHWQGACQPMTNLVPFLLLGDERLAPEAETQDARRKTSRHKQNEAASDLLPLSRV